MKNIDQLQLYLSLMDFEPMFTALTEKWLKTNSNKKCIILPKYQQVENQGRERKGGGAGFLFILKLFFSALMLLPQTSINYKGACRTQ